MYLSTRNNETHEWEALSNSEHVRVTIGAKEFTITVTNGELEIQAQDHSLLVQPVASNKIIINTTTK